MKFLPSQTDKTTRGAAAYTLLFEAVIDERSETKLSNSTTISAEQNGALKNGAHFRRKKHEHPGAVQQRQSYGADIHPNQNHCWYTRATEIVRKGQDVIKPQPLNTAAPCCGGVFRRMNGEIFQDYAWTIM
uniref:Uncharacterized protein n=1 Tax=Hippocampus comes TaxID=109280 RepID=A0A3Q2YT70_HIPCM